MCINGQCVSMAQWLGIHVGISTVTARQHVIVARRLVLLPAICAAFGRGAVTFSKVRAICRVATPSDESRWLDLARNATAQQLERIVSDTIRAVKAMEPDQPERQATARRLAWWFDDDGMCHLSGVLPPEIGTLLANLIRQERVDSHESGDELEQRDADAFGRIIERANQPGSDMAPVLVVVHCHEDGTATLEGGPPISPALTDRLAADAEFVTATHTADVIRYSQRRRTAPVSMRRYLRNRDRCCRFPRV